MPGSNVHKGSRRTVLGVLTQVCCHAASHSQVSLTARSAETTVPSAAAAIPYHFHAVGSVDMLRIILEA